MSKSRIHLKHVILAPVAEMPALVATALRASGAKNFFYDENINTVQAVIEESQPIRQKSEAITRFPVEVSWVKEPVHLSDLSEISDDHVRYADSVKVNIYVSREQGFKGYEDLCTGKAETIFNDLKQHARKTIEKLGRDGPPTDYGSASFATLNEVSEQGYVLNAALEPKQVSRSLLVGSFEEETIIVPERFTEAHALVVGQSGSGKSRGVFIPNLNERLLTSAIVTEVTGRKSDRPVVFERTAGFREAQGHQVFHFNPVDFTSTRFNIIDFIEDMSDALKYAHLLITNTTAKYHMGDQIWVQSETQLLTSLLLYARGLRGDEQSVEDGLSNLGHIRNLLRHGPEAVQQFIERNGIPESRRRFAEFMNNSSDKFRLGVFSGLISRLNPWLDPGICKLTEVTDFDLETLRRKLFTFYLSFPIGRSAQFRPIMALILNLLLSFAQDEKFDEPLTLLLDEFAAFGNIPGIDDVQATIRNAGIGIVLGFQDFQQLVPIYGRDQAHNIYINTNTKLIFATDSEPIRRRVKDDLGASTKVSIGINSSGNVTRRHFGRPLMTESEISQIPETQLLVLRSRKKSFIATACDYGKYEDYATRYPLNPRPEHVPTDTLKGRCAEANVDMPDLEAAEYFAKGYQKHRKALAMAERAYTAAAESTESTELEVERLKDLLSEAQQTFIDFMEGSRQQHKNIQENAAHEVALKKSSAKQKSPDGKKPASDEQNKQSKKKTRQSPWEKPKVQGEDDDDDSGPDYGY